VPMLEEIGRIQLANTACTRRRSRENREAPLVMPKR